MIAAALVTFVVLLIGGTALVINRGWVRNPLRRARHVRAAPTAFLIYPIGQFAGHEPTEALIPAWPAASGAVVPMSASHASPAADRPIFVAPEPGLADVRSEIEDDDLDLVGAVPLVGWTGAYYRDIDSPVPPELAD